MGAREFIRRKLAGARQYSPAELALVPAALVLLGFARLAIASLPLGTYRPWLGRPVAPDTTPRPASASADKRARAVGRAVRATASVTPWRADCLPQAMAAAALLRVLGVPYRLSIGWGDATPGPERQPMLAHAWLEAADRVVTGGPLQPDQKARLAFTA
ncbi:lasso peptide biosynthesis B2 protein [Parerythrobacter aurantius]|uniref:lasso peptide biosynthesis B2 protein n=1 Tax=Parerythrobacter aurantius TaxID=3127706 RepID=UPI00325007AA